MPKCDVNFKQKNIIKKYIIHNFLNEEKKIIRFVEAKHKNCWQTRHKFLFYV